MKKVNLIVLTLVLLFFFACKKQLDHNVGPSASVTLINAIASFGPEAQLKVNFTGEPMNYSSAINMDFYYYTGNDFSDGRVFGVPAGRPIPLTIATAADTVNPIYNRTITFNQGDVYSLFVSGIAAPVDTLLVREQMPVYSDSSMGIRFINLSPNLGTISVNLAGNAAASEVAALPYKGITSFLTYPATAADQFYTFEIRSVETGDLLWVYEFNPYFNFIPRFRNVTLVIKGLKDVAGAPGLDVKRINNN